MICAHNKITGKICQIYLSWYQGQNTGCPMHIPLPFMAVVIRLRKLWNRHWHQDRLWKLSVPWKTWPEFFMVARKWKQKEEEFHHFDTAHSFHHGPGSWVMQLLGSTRAVGLAPLCFKQLTNPVIFRRSKQLARITSSANAECNLSPSRVILLMYASPLQTPSSVLFLTGYKSLH